MFFKLPALPYSYDALEPYVDARTMEIHHTKHHQTYVDKANQIVAQMDAEYALKGGDEVNYLLQYVASISKYPMALRNHLGGHLNHWLFWHTLKAGENHQPSGILLQDLEQSFGSFQAFQHCFTQAAVNHFGSGWVWLVMPKNGDNLIVTTTSNQDNPMMDTILMVEQGIPILGLDLWEHAYYLCYQNKRPVYVEAFWKIINWEVVEKRLTTKDPLGG